MQNNERKYLNEDKFQKNKKMLTKVGIIIMAVGVIAGLTLILIGVIKANNSSGPGTTKQELETRKIELENELGLLENQYDRLSDQVSAERLDAGTTDKYYELKAQRDAMYREITDN